MEKVSVTKMDEYLKNNFINEEIIELNGLQVSIKKTIGIKEMVTLVSKVVASCFDPESGECMFYIKDFILRREIISAYSNVAMPSSLEHQYKIVYNSGVFEEIINRDNAEVGAIIRAINKEIDNRVLNNNNAMVAEMNKLITAVGSVYEVIKSAIGDITPEQAASFAKAFTQNGIDEEKLMKTWLEINKGDA